MPLETPRRSYRKLRLRGDPAPGVRCLPFAEAAFVACSGKCLERHLRAVHGEVPLDAEVRARASQSK